MMRHDHWFRVVALLLLPALMAGSCGAPTQDTTPQGTDATGDFNPADGAEGDVVADQFIVATHPGSSDEEVQALFDEVQVEGLGQSENLATWLVGFEADRREEVRGLLGSSLLVEQVLENRIYHVELFADDPQLSNEWHLATVQAAAAWDTTTGNSEMLVAVIDTGVEASHPDLLGKVVQGTNLWHSSTDTGDGYGHGTMVAGVIAAAGNNGVGVAPLAWLNPVLPVRVTSDTGQTSSWILANGIQWAAEAGAKVINVSFAPLQNDTIVLRQCQLARLAGALVVISAGNTGKEGTGDGSEAALFVSATDSSDKLAGFSTFGDFVDISGPGVAIWTTKINGQYGTPSGTSFAAPVVAGTAALVWSVNPEFRPVTVRQILLATADDIGPDGKDSQFGVGRVNAAAAVAMAVGFVEEADSVKPTVSIRSPSNAAELGAPTAVNVTADDNDAVADVTLYVDGSPIAADFIAPYQFLLNPARFTPGTHLVRAVASDVAGNTAKQEILVTFTGPPDTSAPTIRMLSPANGAEVDGVVTIRADAVDNRSITLAEVLIDGTPIGSVPFQEAGARLAFNWDASTVAPGEHTIVVRAHDSSGNTSTASVRVIVTR